MAGTTVTIDDPSLVITKTADQQGRVYLGSEYKGEKLRVVIEELSDNPESAEKEEQDATHSEESESDSKDSEKDVTPTDEESEESEGDTSSWLDAGEESEDSSE